MNASTNDLIFSDIHFRYRTPEGEYGRPVLCGASGVFRAARRTALIGPDGSGKSTLVKILAGILRADSGEIQGAAAVDDRAVNHKARIDSVDNIDNSVQTGASSVGLLFQEGALFDSLSVFDNVAFPLVGGRVPTMTLAKGERQVVHDQVEEILAAVGLSQHSEKIPGQLSGGMRRRVALARALVSRPGYLFLDDPTAGLDPVSSQVIMELIDRMYRSYSPTLVMVSHDLRRLMPFADDVVALFEGRVLFCGPRLEVPIKAPSCVNSFLACRGGIGASPAIPAH